jgi:hypothetical protein
MEGRPEVIIGDLAPAPDLEVVSVHVFAGDVPFQPGGLGVNLVFDLADYVSERGVGPAAL